MSSIPAPTFKVGLTPEEKSVYAQLFKKLDPENTGIITGEKARSTFEKSGLPPSILGEIWQFSDPKNLGFLTQFGFCHAMRLIGYTQAGQHPSATLAETPGPLPKFADLDVPTTPQALNPQSTSNSFMQTQPSSIIPQNTTTSQFKPQDPISSISPQDYQKFSQLFIKTVGSSLGELAGNQARDIFLKAKLPTATLGQIWNLVDRFNVGKLNIGGFVIAMHLIQGLLSGQIKQLPPFLPEGIWQSVEQKPLTPVDAVDSSRQVSRGSVNSQQTTLRYPSTASSVSGKDSAADWVASPAMVQQYEFIFNGLDKAKTGHLNPEQVASFLMTSKLGQQDLAGIWDLSDIQNTGIFSLLEFSIALFLVNKRLAGEKLPNIVPDTLVGSLRTLVQNLSSGNASATPQTQQSQQPQQLEKPVQKSNMDDLADIFATPTPPASSPTKSTLENRASSADLNHSTDLPKIRNNLTGSFKPTSTFGQQLLQKQHTDSTPKDEKASLLGDDVSNQQKPENIALPAPVVSPDVNAGHQEQRAINYDALRSVPPPPPVKRDNSILSSQSSQDRISTNSSFSNFHDKSAGVPLQQQTIQERSTNENIPSFNNPSPNAPNDDLFADSNPEISGQLSQASTDIVNVSNQIKSLTSQTTSLQEKKSRAEQELKKILNAKKEIEAKLSQLRTSYQNEVKLVEQVETNLKTAREEAEALRSEASISEAKLNALSSQLHEKQLSMEDLQKQNSLLTEKLGTMNAEIVDLEKQVDSHTTSNEQLTKQLNVKKSQVQVVLVKHQDLRSKIAEFESKNNLALKEISEAEAEHSRLLDEHPKLEQAHQTLLEKQAKLEQDRANIHSKIANQKTVLLGLKSKVDAAQKNYDATASKVDKEQPVDHSRGVLTGTAIGVGTGIAAAGAAIGATVFASHEAGAEPAQGEQKDVLENHEFDNKESNAESRPPYEGLSSLSVHDSATDYATNATGPNSVTTNVAEGETPVTSPNNSEFQFAEHNQGISIPRDLVGVQRTDSLTSSVQNNAALSVRDDNIDVSDRETLSENNLGYEQSEFENENKKAGRPVSEKDDTSDGDKFSSGVESFEIVNAEDAKQGSQLLKETDGSNESHVKEPEQTKDQTDKSTKDSTEPSAIDKEFPPIKELDYDESSSDDDGSNEDNFDDAKENFVSPSQGRGSDAPPLPKKVPLDDFDSAFNQLEPATPAPKEDDLFADEFDDLELANVDNAEDNFPEGDFSFSNEFTSDAPTESKAVDFGNAPQGTEGNDEWEQLFAGFGNSQAEVSHGAAVPNVDEASTPVVPPAGGAVLDSSKDQALHELVGMGFDETTALEALKKENWNLVEATNYLLDNA